MKGLLHVLAWLLIFQGLGGLLNTVFGWWRWAHDLLLVNILPFLDGYEVFAAIVIGVLGVALAAASGSARKAADRT
ncbi:hypothetical protein ABZ297_32210 [Nonomuraea sp. NPDC005983]|uniref:hypothetical protein n=1 Tax=Nonomuraea sp. NPDC005983 TaxID=3155595 RepID=UPI0033B58A70